MNTKDCFIISPFSSGVFPKCITINFIIISLLFLINSVVLGQTVSQNLILNGIIPRSDLEQSNKCFLAVNNITSSSELVDNVSFTTYKSINLVNGFNTNNKNFSANIRPIPNLNSFEAPDTIGQYEKFEINMDLSNFMKDPFNPKDITVFAIFTSPSGIEYNVNGFYYVDFDYNDSICMFNADGGNNFALSTYENRDLLPIKSDWRIRFSPNEIGAWSFRLGCLTDNISLNYFGSGIGNFICNSSNNHGFIKVDTIYNKYLQFTDLTSLFLIGENISNGANANTKMPLCEYKNYYIELSQNGGNYVRHCQQILNESNNYNMENAYRLDKLFEYADQYGIKVKLNITNWLDIDICDTLDNQIESFFRYLIARYGYATNLVSWEIIDEQGDEVLGCPSDAISWFNVVKKIIRDLEGDTYYKHLISSGGDWVDKLDFDVYQQIQGDFVEVHYAYGLENAPLFTEICNVGQYFNSWNETSMYPILKGKRDILIKPIFINSFWHSDGGNNWGNTPNSTYIVDPHGFMVHSGMWMSLFSNNMASAVPFYHNCTMHPGFKIDSSTYYSGLLGQFKQIKDFSNFIDFRKDLISSTNYPPEDNEISVFLNDQETQSVRVFSMQDLNEYQPKFYGWLQDSNYNYENLFINYCNYLKDFSGSRPSIISDAKLRLKVNTARNYKIEWYEINKESISAMPIQNPISYDLHYVYFDIPSLDGIYGDYAFIIFLESEANLKSFSIVDTNGLSFSKNSLTENCSNIEILPNPTEGLITINNLPISLTTIKLYNNYGLLIYSIKNNSEKLDINISNYPAGLYLLNVTNGNKVKVMKIIKY